MALAPLSDEYCPSCGEWVFPLNFNYVVGWCSSCSQEDGALRCYQCGVALPETDARTLCHTCRQEQWYARHAHELEWLMVVKGYSLNQARQTIVKLVRPICQFCGKPIRGASDGALFHKDRKPCRRAYGIYNRLIKKGLTPLDSLAIMKERA